MLATAFLTIAVALDGDGATTFMITISAMLPIYQRLQMSRLVLSGTICLAAGVMNLIPWGGPTARAMTTLNVDSLTLFNPVIPAMIVGLIWVFAVAYYFGKKERARLGVLHVDFEHEITLTEEEAKLRRPHLLWFNLLLTAVLVVSLILAVLPLPVLFMIAFGIALVVNFPDPKEQLERINSQAKNVGFVSSMIFAAGIFTGILTGTKMITAMSQTLVSWIPDPLSPFLPLIVAFTSMPLSLVFTPDAYYFGVLPIVSQTAAAFGIDPVSIGRAAILGQMTTGFPLSPLTASTFILVGMSGVELGDHQKHIFWWAFGSTVVMTIVCLLTGAIQL
ncbi:CitMHS family transporter [Acetonema longum]|uniref:Citrate transporter n=1 Tax=Acetonema longum DSM 6540 TaxID=1009370 RepID=F7NMU2_9FIRM|nr:citrate:proton symporter [Acetonema longum]EGO62636.1 citrate transporter [Acetonema longum DSM 6540]